MAKTLASQARNGGSIPLARSFPVAHTLAARSLRRVPVFIAAIAAIATLVAAGRASAAAAPARCDFGRPVSERVLLRPRPGTFYSIDALNPDVVRTPGGYRLYFSGNDQPSAAGDWHTGVAFADSPLGPFRVRARAQFAFLNGGTVRARGRYYHGATGAAGPALYRSRDGLRWHKFADVPQPAVPAWDAIRSDLYLVARRDGLDIYYAGRPGPSGADLGVLRYRHGRFVNSEALIGRLPGAWDGLDLGEPAVFRARGRTYMLYGGLGENGGPRRIGIAYRTPAGWRTCSRPLLDVSPRYPQNAIDPEPVVHNGRLYVYFGGGVTPSLGGNMNGTIWVRVYRLGR
jgi:hypothetical protein